MASQSPSLRNKIIFLAQLFSVLFIWIFVIVITAWIINLILLSIELNDAPGASVAISIVAIPVFMILASVLTYVFIGLQKEHRRTQSSAEDQ